MKFKSAVEFVKMPYWNPPLVTGTRMNGANENMVKPEMLVCDPYPEIMGKKVLSHENILATLESRQYIFSGGE